MGFFSVRGEMPVRIIGARSASSSVARALLKPASKPQATFCIRVLQKGRLQPCAVARPDSGAAEGIPLRRPLSEPPAAVMTDFRVQLTASDEASNASSRADGEARDGQQRPPPRGEQIGGAGVARRILASPDLEQGSMLPFLTASEAYWKVGARILIAFF